MLAEERVRHQFRERWQGDDAGFQDDDDDGDARGQDAGDWGHGRWQADGDWARSSRRSTDGIPLIHPLEARAQRPPMR